MINVNSSEDKNAKGISRYIRAIYEKIKNFHLFKPKRSIIIVVCGIGVVFGFVVLRVLYINSSENKINSKLHHVDAKLQNKKAVSIASQMQKNALIKSQDTQRMLLQDQLKQLQKTIADSSLSQNKINALEMQIGALEQSIQSLQESTNTAKEAAVKTVIQEQKHAEMESNRVKQLQKQLSKISKVIMPHKYLPASVLPFKVSGLDFWNGEPMVNISKNDAQGVIHYQLIGQGMRYSNSGWEVQKIRSVSNERKEIIFVNGKNQHVRVEL